ncbi:MAG TPA: amino acid ABC transporter permease [Pseudogracilibacillus sp.]|nr:amino acid ABC transporter permease [Pseudogracilibacillus sp.]
MDKYFDSSYLWGAFPVLLPFLKVTFLFVGCSVVIGFSIGLALAIMKLSEKSLLRKLANGYTTVLRCTPSIVLLFLVYYGIPAIGKLLGLNLNEIPIIVFVVTAFSLQFGAIISEVIRSAYLSVNKEQYEAGVSVGMSPFQVYRRIIVPQAIVIALPNLGNSLISLLQEGALAYTIGFIDIVGKAELIIASNYNTHALEVFIALAIIYWVLSIMIEQLFLLLERYFSKGKQRLKTS